MKAPETIPALLAKLKVAWPLYEAALRAYGRADEASTMTTGQPKLDKARDKAAGDAERRVKVLEKRAMGLRKRIIATPARSLNELLTKMLMVYNGDFEEEKALLPVAIIDLARLIGKAPPAGTA